MLKEKYFEDVGLTCITKFPFESILDSTLWPFNKIIMTKSFNICMNIPHHLKLQSFTIILPVFQTQIYKITKNRKK